METLTLAQINSAVDAAFQSALAQSPAQRVSATPIGDNATLRTDIYTGPQGLGFVVVAVVDLKFRKLVIAKQHGPETWREQPAPSDESLLDECRKARAKEYPSVTDQMDMLWHAMDDGTLPKVEPFYSTIKAVKDSVPKPQ